MVKIEKWYSKTEWVDTETGEIIPTINKHLYIKTKLLGKTTKISKNGKENIGTRISTYGCKFNGQLSIEYPDTRTHNEYALHVNNNRRREFLRNGIISSHRDIRYKG